MKITALRFAFISVAAMLLTACNTSSPSGMGMQNTSAPASAYGTANVGGDADLRQVPDLPSPPETSGGTEVPIAAADTLDIFVFQVPDLSRTVQVDTSGNVSLPLIGIVPVAGKPVRMVEQEITRIYGAKYLQNPQITVTIKDSAARRVTIDGEIKKAGVYPLPTTASLLDAIALGGGFSPIADTSKVYVFREVSGQKFVAQYDVAKIRSGGQSNPRLYGGDVVVVFSSSSRIALQNLKEALGVASSASRVGTFL